MSGRVGERTAALLEPPPTLVSDASRHRVRDGLAVALSAVAGAASGPPVEVSLPLLRRARSRPGSLGLPEARFAWRPSFVRRSLGLAVVQACAEGRYVAPTAAVGPVADAALGEWRRTGWRTYHWEPWLAGLGSGARAAVLAEAVGWASTLWTTFEWSALDGRVRFGGPDDRWCCSGAPSVRLKGRSELRVALGGQGADPAATGTSGVSALVTVAGGVPLDGWHEELTFLALVAGLRAPDLPVPARVFGLWPDAGIRRMVDVDEELLNAASGRVVAAAASVVAARRLARPG